MLAALLFAQVFTPHAAETARTIIAVLIAAIVILRHRLLYVLAYGLLIVFAIVVVLGTVTLAHLLHGLSGRNAGACPPADGTSPNCRTLSRREREEQR